MLQKTKRLTLAEQVAWQIEQLIETGAWPVGTKIPPEPELMEELNVSRNTLREAVRALIHSGMLSTRQGDGTYVCSSSALGPVLQKRVQRTDKIETLEVRHALEREAAVLAAERRTEQDLAEIRDCLQRGITAVENGDHAAYAESDMDFHRSIIAASHNTLLAELYDHMTEGLRDSITEVVQMSDHACFLQNHEQLLQAIVRQDSTQAAEAVRLYIEQSKQYL